VFTIAELASHATSTRPVALPTCSTPAQGLDPLAGRDPGCRARVVVTLTNEALRLYPVRPLDDRPLFIERRVTRYRVSIRLTEQRGAPSPGEQRGGAGVDEEGTRADLVLAEAAMPKQQRLGPVSALSLLPAPAGR
jgi:hypothetical protein